MNTSISIQNFWNEFIDLYRDLPALWQKESDDYKNKQIKQRSYTVLTNKLKELSAEATVATTKRKINSLRSNYRKEVRKVEDSLVAGDDPAYTPRSWYYKKMNFLEGENRDLKRNSSFVNYEELTTQPEDYDYIETPEDEDMPTSKPIVETTKETDKYMAENDDPGPDSLVHKLSPSPLTIVPNQNFQLKIERIESLPIRVDRLDEEKDEVSCSQLEPTNRMHIDQNESGVEEECEVLARAWLIEFKKLNQEQQLFANKAINDILFEGRLKKLCYHSVKVNEDLNCICSSK